MKISKIKFNKEVDGIKEFEFNGLGNTVILSGCNGSGKTRLLKSIERHVKRTISDNNNKDISIYIQSEDFDDRELNNTTIGDFKIINYSHYDAQLQSPKKFSPYVIGKAKNLLKELNYAETALNSLLFLQDVANEYSVEFQNTNDFEKLKKYLQEKFEIEISKDENNNILIFGLDVDKYPLSPGQQYILRIAIACYCNETNNNVVFFLDEPELHLHPKALLKLVSNLRNKFYSSQFWISTHSLELISYLSVNEKDISILFLNDGNVGLFRSNSSDLLNGLLGDEDNRFAIQQLLYSPDEFACNKFAIECFKEDQTLPAKKGDLQNKFVSSLLKPNDVVVDFGSGKGRLFEGLALDSKNHIERSIVYYAYDCSDKDSEICKRIMNQYGSTDENYFNDESLLVSKVNGSADYVLLINVLHEIEPIYWVDVLKTINSLLKESGKLIIVERDELTVGESPYYNGFQMITHESSKKLFDDVSFERNNEKKYIVKYSIDKNNINVTKEKVLKCIEHIKNESLEEISKVKAKIQRNDEWNNKFKYGIKLAFWLN